ncbi:PAS domain S-box protein [Peribacillus saganii]|nr:PAS domain S-box protein [Peribacillus saganii]
MKEAQMILSEWLKNGPHLSLFNNLPDAIYVLDINGKYIDGNLAIKNLTGYSAEEFKQLTPEEIIYESSLSHRDAILQNVTQKIEEYEVKFRHKDGQILTASVTYIPIIHENEIIGLYGIAKNISEDIKGKLKIIESERKFRLLSESSLDMIALLSPRDWNFIYVSPASKHLLGFEPEEMVGHSPFKYFHPEDIATTFEKHKQAFERKLEFKMTARVKQKGGDYIWLETTCNFNRDETSGEITDCVTVSRDITKRKKDEEKYKINEQWYKSLFDYNPAAVFSFNMDGDFISHNKNFLTLTGYSKEEIGIMSFIPFVAPKDLALTVRHFELAKQGEPQHYLTTLVHKNGEHLPVQVSNLPIIIDGNIVGVYGIAYDVSARVKAEGQLKESEQRYRSLFEYNPAAVYSFDLEGNYTSVNRMLEKISGYSKEELLTMNFSHLLDPEDIEYTQWYFSQAKGGKAQNYDVTLLHKDGRKIEINVVNIPIIVDSDIVGVYGICTDITDRKRYINQVERLSNQNRLILDSVADGIIGLDKAGKALFINKAGEKILGYEEYELSARASDLFMLHNQEAQFDSLRTINARIRETAKDGRQRFVERDMFYKKDGNSIPVEYSISPMYEHGVITGTVVTFSDITEKLKIEQLKQEHEQIEFEFKLASRVQKSLLTQVPKLSLPGETDVGVISVPFRKLNGDFYNVVNTGDQIQLGIADISGKGMAAAILMSMIKYAMDQIDQESLPHEILHELNQYCAKYLDPTMFVTMFMGIYNDKTSMFHFASAGHEPAILYQAGKNKMIDLNAKGAVLGLSRETKYVTKSIQLLQGDMVLLYTDGITEERLAYGVDDNNNLKELFFSTDKSLPAQQVVDSIYKKVCESQGDNIFDDQTLLLFKKN